MFLMLISLLQAQAMPEQEFQYLLRRMDDASFTSEQIDILQNLPKSTSIRCAEVVKLIEPISFANDQIAAIKILLPYISDLNNRHLLVDSMSFSSDKKKVGDLLDKEYAKKKDAAVEKKQERKENKKECRFNIPTKLLISLL